MEPINETAARWAVRAAAGQLNPGEQRELDLWLDADPRHRGAYVRARAQWMDLDRLAALNGPIVSASEPSDELDRAAPVAAAPVVSRRQLIAASIAAVVGGGLSWALLRGGRESYASGIGEVRRISLADGSTLLLNTDSEVTLRLTKERRDIHLVRGEALFEVAHDELRAFVVTANDTAVRAVGTAFAVRLDSTGVNVTVTEGVVEVVALAQAEASNAGASPTTRAPTQRVVANERLVIARAGAEEVRAIAPGEANRQLAWREGQVSFDGESLSVAVAEINRHNRRQIVVDDPTLGSMPLVGVFRATDLEGFAAAVAVALKAEAVSEGDLIRLKVRAASPQS